MQPRTTVSVPSQPGAFGPDVQRLATGAGPALDYLSRTARHLGIPDPVQEYFGPVVGRWRDLREQARCWHRAAHAVEELGDRVSTPLGGLDAVWEGAVADSFVEHMKQVAAAGKSVSDAMTAMGEVLDRTAEAVEQLVTDLIELLSGGADRGSTAMISPAAGEQLASRQLTEVRGYSRRLFEAVRETLEAFVELCDGMEAGQPFAEVRMAASFPQQTWSFDPKLPAAPEAVPAAQPVPDVPAAGTDATAAVTGAGAGGVGGGGGFGGGGFGGGGLGGGGGGAGRVAAPEPAVRPLAAEPLRADTQPAAAAAGGGASGSGAGSGRGAGGAPFMPMGMGAGMGGQDNEHRSKSRVTADPTDLFGRPTKTSPPVIGED